MALPEHWLTVLDVDLSRLPTGPGGALRDCSEQITSADLVWVTGLRRQSVTVWLSRNGVRRTGREDGSDRVTYSTPELLHTLRNSRGQGNHTSGSQRGAAVAKRRAALAARQ